MQNTTNTLLPAEREILVKERATLIDRLTFVERLLGEPSSVLGKQQRRDERRQQQRSDHASPDRE
jgi:hypothetical protein